MKVKLLSSHNSWYLAQGEDLQTLTVCVSAHYTVLLCNRQSPLIEVLLSFMYAHPLLQHVFDVIAEYI